MPPKLTRKPGEKRGRKPLPAGEGKTDPISVRLPQEIADRLETALASMQKALPAGAELSKSALIVTLIREGLDRHERKLARRVPRKLLPRLS